MFASETPSKHESMHFFHWSRSEVSQSKWIQVNWMCSYVLEDISAFVQVSSHCLDRPATLPLAMIMTVCTYISKPKSPGVNCSMTFGNLNSVMTLSSMWEENCFAHNMSLSYTISPNNKTFNFTRLVVLMADLAFHQKKMQTFNK